MDFDVVVLGTGLSESVAAAALSKAGYKVAHVDTNQYYGGDEASLTVEELAEWADARASDDPSSDYLANQRARYTSITRSQTIPPQSRQYSVSLAPSIVPSIGPHIDSLIASGVSRYGQFKLLEKVAVYDRPGYVQSVPGSKEDVFKSKALSLLDKRRLMRFLMFAAGDFEGKKELEGKEQTPFVQYLQDVFSLKDQATSAIAYALAFCTSAEEPTLPAMQRIRQYLRSAGRYGASPFLVGHYGGLGETAQGFCRTSAVKGGTYILGRRVVSVESSPDDSTKDEKSTSTSHSYSVKLIDFDERLTAKVLVSSPDYVPTSLGGNTSTSKQSAYAVARCVAIIDKPLVFTPSEVPEDTPSTDTDGPTDGPEDEPSEKPEPPSYDVDTALLVFPPGCLQNGSTTTAVHALVTGEGSMSAPRGRYIVNISLSLSESTLSSSAEELLRPYLEAALSLTAPPSSSSVTSPATSLFSLFYIHHTPAAVSSAPPSSSSSVIVTPPSRPHLPTIADEATEHAEAMFWTAVKQLKAAGVQRTVPKEEAEEGDASVEKAGTEDTSPDIDSFWPPLDAVEDETSDEW
ncbi:FAD/NAD(P)-binding domain-containing protein [Lentinus tigrinus ALCF2SS1-7]|uniref:FAD/NAD(P)-binding domain-containing protein n=1 Tax=Lentinus tigrinus ALCF2SS1-6 TaxID=1328759 RepID=A0A5C2SFP7_9APHY|nr:FAD/NAD(P)-binding domain-containing protein [Lentinus tigrinus ALCF2SS1-6]RPD74627.1 FAD/NAD(P)-binding domain-containing protein [Lentinus tigrinus ALCF2SS1-7]